jgi:hypothetical protein
MKNKALLVVAMLSTFGYSVLFVAHGLCSLITILIASISAILWLWVAFLFRKEKAAMSNMPLLSDINLKIAAAVTVAFATLATTAIAVLSVIQQKC